MLDLDTERQLLAIQASEKSYRPSAEVAATLRKKNLVMLVGPVAVGKSFVIDQVSRTDPTFKQVSVFTTRDARPDDDPHLFRIIPHTNAALKGIFDKIKKRTLVQYTVHPTTGRIYGTIASDFNAEYNMLPTLSGAVDPRAQLPFAATSTICLTARPEVWQMWLNSRYPDKDAERAKRIKEAIVSLKWALDDTRKSTISWVENNVQYPEKTVENIINIVKYNYQDDPAAKEYAKQMLELAIAEAQGLGK